MAFRRFPAFFLATIAWTGVLLRPVIAVEGSVQSYSTCIDCALGSGGMLEGQVVDPQGAPRAHDQVVIFHGEQAIAKTLTDADGRFRVAGVRGGIHEVATKGGSEIVRCWSADSAPPQAVPAVLLHDQGLTACGQMDEINPRRIKILTLTALGLSVTALTLSVILPLVLQDDEDAS